MNFNAEVNSFWQSYLPWVSQVDSFSSYHPSDPRVGHYTLLLGQPVPFQHIGAEIIAANIMVSTINTKGKAIVTPEAPEIYITCPACRRWLTWVKPYSVEYINHAENICLNDQQNSIQNSIFYLDNILDAKNKWNHALNA